MKISRLKYLCCGLVGLLSVGLAAPAPSALVKSIQHWTNKQGIPVYFISAQEVPIVDINVLFKAGTAYDGPHFGLSYLTNIVARAATQQRNPDQWADAIDDVGAQVSGSVTRDMVAMHLRSLSDPQYFKPALALFHEQLTQPALGNNQVTNKKNLLLSFIQRQQAQPSYIGQVALFHAIYGDQAYAHPRLGTQETVSAITQKQIAQFYTTYYTQRNASIIIVGALTVTQAHDVADHLLNGMTRGTAIPDVPHVTTPTLIQAINRIPFSTSQTTVLLGQLGIPMNSPLRTTLTVGNFILGGDPLNSILYKQLRESRGLTYGVSSMWLPFSQRGVFLMMCKTRDDKAQESLGLMQDLLARYIKDGPTNKQVQQAKKSLHGSFPLGLATNSDRISALSQLAFYHLPLNEWDLVLQRLDQVTPAAVQSAFQKVLQPNKPAVVLVGPTRQEVTSAATPSLKKPQATSWRTHPGLRRGLS